jgi:hypothetical protein
MIGVAWVLSPQESHALPPLLLAVGMWASAPMLRCQ